MSCPPWLSASTQVWCTNARCSSCQALGTQTSWTGARRVTRYSMLSIPAILTLMAGPRCAHRDLKHRQAESPSADATDANDATCFCGFSPWMPRRAALSCPAAAAPGPAARLPLPGHPAISADEGSINICPCPTSPPFTQPPVQRRSAGASAICMF